MLEKIHGKINYHDPRKRIRRLFIDNIRLHGRQPFVQIGCIGGSGAYFVNCATNQDISEFNGVISSDEMVSRSPLLSFIALSLKSEFYDAAVAIHSWIETDEENACSSPLFFSDHAHNLRCAADLPAYVVRDRSLYDKLPSRTETEKCEQTWRLLDAYDTASGNDSGRWLLIEGLSLGLCRYLGSRQMNAEALRAVDIGLKYAPKSIHLRAAEHALRLRLDSKPVPPRLEKFVNHDNGTLKGKICPEPFKRFDISPSGEVLVCCGHWLPTPIGNVMTEDVEEIINSEQAKKIRGSILDGTYKYCNHLECNALIQGYLPEEEEIEAALSATTEVEAVDQVLFSFDQSCNLACPSCRRERIIEKPSLNAAKADIVADKLAPLLKGLKRLDINPAGELFSSKPSRRLLSMIDPEESPDLSIHVISNGTLFTENEWKKLANVQGLIQSIRISTDAASKETFEKLRRFGIWEIFVKNMKFLRSLRQSGEVPELTLSFTYQLENFREMPAFVEFGRHMGCDLVIFERLQNLGAFTWNEFKEKAVHLSEHALHDEFLSVIGDPMFASDAVWHDFDWEGAAVMSDARTRLRREMDGQVLLQMLETASH